MHFAIVNPSTGVVHQFVGGIPASELESYPLQAEHQLVSCPEFGADPLDYVYSVAGGVVRSPRGESPGEGFRFNPVSRVWVDFRSLEQVKSERWEFIKAEREKVINARLDTPYGAVDSGERDRVNITNSVMMLQTLAGLGTPGTVQFTMADNSTAVLDTDKMVHIGLLLGQKIEAAHSKARTLRANIEAALTKEDVEAVTWD